MESSDYQGRAGPKDKLINSYDRLLDWDAGHADDFKYFLLLRPLYCLFELIGEILFGAAGNGTYILSQSLGVRGESER